jgi:hypothetical protein
MSAEEFRRRLRKLGAELAKLNPEPSTNDELIAALEAYAATPIQMEQIWAIAQEDIRSQVIRVARERRLFYDAGGSYKSDVTLAPVTRTIEILSHRADEPLDLALEDEPLYFHKASSDESGAKRIRRHVPSAFKTWARTVLMTKLLGNDGGMGLRGDIDEWMDGGDPPIDVDRYPHEDIYHLVLPIDGDPALMFDARMLRLPHAELYKRIGNYPCWEAPESWDSPDGGQMWTPVDITGFERL